MKNKNLLILTISQIFSFTAAPITVFLSGIIGSSLSEIKILATLPTALTVVGTAISSLIAALIMSKYGRKFGFLLGCFCNSFASILGAYAIIADNFLLYCLSCLLIGFGLAFTAQYRFAAAESVSKDFIPNAISIVLIGGIFSALLGPTIATATKDLILDKLYVGSYISLSLLTIIPVFSLSFYKNEKKITINKQFRTRGVIELLKKPKIIQAISAASFAYAIMTFIMTATPISMHIIDNISLYKTGLVIQWHVISMFLPSLITGYLIKKYKHTKIMYLGIISLFICLLVNLIGQNFLNYLLSLIFLGIGWNFLNISATSLLVTSYEQNEKFQAQGANDFIVFSIQASASLLAGYSIIIFNWKSINMACIPILLILVLLIYVSNRKKNKKSIFS